MTHTTSGPTRAKLESNVKIICTEMDENSFRRDDNDCRDMFITTHILEKIWPEERLEEFFEGYPWADKKFVQRVHQKFLKVLSVLVRLQCSDLEIFKNCFYDTGKEDSNLPFHDLSEISELDTPVANDFRTHQYNFIPITIEENKDHTFSESYRFPFVKKSELIAEDKGSACVMYKEFVAPRQLININGESNAEVIIPSCLFFASMNTLANWKCRKHRLFGNPALLARHLITWQVRLRPLEGLEASFSIMSES